MTNAIIIAILALVLGLAIRYIIKAKKRGATCIGCPTGGCGCSKDSSADCCCCHTDAE